MCQIQQGKKENLAMLHNVLGIASSSSIRIPQSSHINHNLVIFKIVRMNLLKLSTKTFLNIIKELDEAPSESTFYVFLVLYVPQPNISK